MYSDGVMNAKQMKQVLPAVDQIHGWGNTMQDKDIEIIETRCDKVIAFTVTKPETDDMGYVLTLTRIAGSGTLWTMSSGSGEAYLIDTSK
jgi:hypothetical protein